jgi:hypothetical protein
MLRQATLIGLVVAVSLAGDARAQTPYDPGCIDDHSFPQVELPNGLPFDAARARTLFRFHRQQEAIRDLDAGRAMVRGPWRWRIPADLRQEITSELDALRNCLATTKPPRLATLTVRFLGHTEDASRMVPQAGARVHVNGISIGRTNRDGRLAVRVPSGPIEVSAEIPISHAGFAEVDLPPGRSGSVEITLSDGKEVAEPSTLVFAQAVDDIVPVTARSMTPRFMQDSRLAPVASIDQIDVVDDQGDFRTDLTKHFSVAGGELVATSAVRVFEVLRPYFGKTIILQVQAMTSSSAMHQGKTAFRVAQWPLTVTLEAPPSKRALSVSNIEVGVSLIGAGIAVQRVSDAQGRLEVSSFPEGTIALECVAVAGGKYYYGDATLTHSGLGSVTVILRNVEDLKNGVPPLRR